jgi:hypothetical protein
MRIILLVLVLLYSSYQCVGQSKKTVYKALDEKNGFKNARFGMNSTQVLGFFKDLFFQEYYNNEKYYVTHSDKMKIGRAAIKKVIYKFYKDRLFSIEIVLYYGNGDGVIPVLESVYGKGNYSTFESWIGNKKIIMVSSPYSVEWSGDKVQMRYQGASNGDHDSLLTIVSLVEMQKQDADEERRAKQALLKAKQDL